jgi:hypothetical protein
MEFTLYSYRHKCYFPLEIYNKLVERRQDLWAKYPCAMMVLLKMGFLSVAWGGMSSQFLVSSFSFCVNRWVWKSIYLKLVFAQCRLYNVLFLFYAFSCLCFWYFCCYCFLLLLQSTFNYWRRTDWNIRFTSNLYSHVKLLKLYKFCAVLVLGFRPLFWIFFFFCVLLVPRRKCVCDRFRFPTV